MAKQSSSNINGSAFARDSLVALDPHSVSNVIAATGDVAMVIDREGVIRDIAAGNAIVPNQHVNDWLDRRWVDTVSNESKPKIEEMLRDAASDSGPRWREINYPAPGGASISMRYIAVNAGDDGRVIAIGRDQRLIAELQQRLVEAQQETEREYQRQRDAESRYRLLFKLTSEAVLVVDASNRKIVEANPAAERLIAGTVVGKVFTQLFSRKSHENAAKLLAAAQSGPNLTAQQTVLVESRALTAAASLFRHERHAYFLVRLAPLDQIAPLISEPTKRLAAVLERMPDAFVVTDTQLKILAENNAFLELTRFASKEQARGQSLEAFFSRPNIDRNILISSLRQHGMLKNFATVFRNRLGETEDVEVSAVYVGDADEPCYGFSIRSGGRAFSARAGRPRELPRSVEQLSQLVGRVTLKELVRESTDLVERLCIEAALEMTGNNRASAAEILGVSRQSLYSKLHRHGLAEFGTESE